MFGCSRAFGRKLTIVQAKLDNHTIRWSIDCRSSLRIGIDGVYLACGEVPSKQPAVGGMDGVYLACGEVPSKQLTFWYLRRVSYIWRGPNHPL